MIRNIHSSSDHSLLVYPYDILKKLYIYTIPTSSLIGNAHLNIGLLMYNPYDVNLWNRLYKSYELSTQELLHIEFKIRRLIRFFLLLVTVPLFETKAFCRYDYKD